MQYASSRTASPPSFPSAAAGHRSGAGASTVLPPLNDDRGGRPRPVSPGEHPGACTPPGGQQDQAAAEARTVGRYLVSPLVRALEDGWFATSVSIRSGSGSGTTDRVLRLTALFRCAREAAAHAHAEALRWISATRFPRAA